MITPEELFAFAESLANARTSEACARAAVSRAYYSVYHACIRELPPEKTTKETGKGLHRSYLDELLGSKSVTISFIGKKLDQLYAQRVKADYHLAYAVTYADANKAVEIAQRLFVVIHKELPAAIQALKCA